MTEWQPIHWCQLKTAWGEKEQSGPERCCYLIPLYFPSSFSISPFLQQKLSIRMFIYPSVQTSMFCKQHLLWSQQPWTIINVKTLQALVEVEVHPGANLTLLQVEQSSAIKSSSRRLMARGSCVNEILHGFFSCFIKSRQSLHATFYQTTPS